MRSALVIVLGGVGVAAFVACGSSTVVLQPVDDGGSDANVTTDAPADGGPIKVGVISLTSSFAPDSGAGSATGGVYFSSATTSACVESTVDGCSVNTCPQNAKGLEQPVSGGQVVISGGTQPVTFKPDDAGHYSSPNIPMRLWNGGEVLTAVGAGETAPGFNLSVIAPAYVNVTDPPWPANGKLTIDRTKPWAFSWTGGGAGKVNFGLTSFTKSNGGVVLNCAFPAASGTGTISTAVLATLPANPVQSSLEITSQSILLTNVSGYVIDIIATALGNGPTTAATATVTLQ